MIQRLFRQLRRKNWITNRFSELRFCAAFLSFVHFPMEHKNWDLIYYYYISFILFVQKDIVLLALVLFWGKKWNEKKMIHRLSILMVKPKKSKTEKNFRAMICRQSGFCEFDV